MKNLGVARLMGWFVAAVAGVMGAGAQTTVLTYQGVLTSNGVPVTGVQQLVFAAYDVASGGEPLAVSPPLSGVGVTNGLFTVPVDFGSAIFDGGARWLEVRVRPQGDTNPPIALRPRQAVNSTPYAIRALEYSGPVQPGQIKPGTITGAMLADGSVGASQLAPGVVGPGQLARPYQAGSFTLASVGTPVFQFRTRRVEREVTFPEPFAGTPSVTLTLETAHAALASKGAVTVKAKTATGFVASFPLCPVGVEVMRSAGTFDPQLTMVGGHPAILGVAVVGTQIGLAYVRAMNAEGTEWGTPTILASGYLGVASLAVVAGRPAVAFVNGLGVLSYVRADDPEGATWPVPTPFYTPVAGSFVGEVVMVEADGKAGVLLRENSTTLRFVGAIEDDGSAWRSPRDLGGGFTTVSGLDLGVFGGKPGVAVTDGARQSVWYCPAKDAMGDNWQDWKQVAADPNPISPWNGPFSGASLFEFEGRPCVGFVESRDINHVDKRVVYARASNEEGTTWGPAVSVDQFRLVFQLDASFARVGAAPRAAVSDRSMLRFADGNSFGPGDFGIGLPYDLEPVNTRVSLADVAGQPGIAFVSEESIRFIRADTAPPNSAITWIAVGP